MLYSRTVHCCMWLHSKMFPKFMRILILIFIISQIKSAKILVVNPTPSLSHQVVFRPLTQELAKRHEVVVITTDPVFKAGDCPVNLTEVDVHDASYGYFKKQFKTIKMGEKSDSKNVFLTSYKFIIEVLGIQLQQPQVQKLFKETFDLLLIESWFRPYLVFSAFWQVPVIKISSFFPLYNDYTELGLFEHRILYPLPSRQKLFNLTRWDEVWEIYNDYNHAKVLNIYEDYENKIIKENINADVPLVSQLNSNVQMLFMNVLPTWGFNRPVPISVISIGGLYQNVNNPLPKELQYYLDASKNGVIYISWGSHVVPSLLPAERMQVIIKVLSELPYDILLRWDLDILPGKPENIKIAKWFPQTDVLSHPNVKLFITHGGLQSSEEALRACVPLLGIPMFLDHWYNSEMYVHHGIGLKLEFESLTEGEFSAAIYELLNDNRYRKNLLKLKALMADQPMTALERAVWWTEHVLRHGGARHLRAPAAGMSWAEYLEIELLLLLIGVIVLMFTLVYVVLKMLYKCLKHLLLKNRLQK